jgi:chromosomal replication initiator protein
MYCEKCTCELKSKKIFQNTIVLIEHVVKCAADLFDIEEKDILGHWRKREVVHARFMAMYFLCFNSKYTLKSIGEYFSGRDHSSVCYSRDEMIKFIHEEPSTRMQYEELVKMINS